MRLLPTWHCVIWQQEELEMRIWIKGGRVIDPGTIDGSKDIRIEDGKIAEIIEPGASGSTPLATGDAQPASRIIDAAGKIVCPGFIDMHVHLREPGHEYKETIETGCRAAAWGGFTAVCAMPNTHPVNDNHQVTTYILRKAAQANFARVYPVGAISMGLEGKRICDYGELKESGAIALSDDGQPVMDAELMRKALEYAKGMGLPVISHCEDLNLTANGVMNAGPVATLMGLAGIPNASESVMVERDIALSELTGAAVHIAHVSAAESIRAIREAKSKGVSVTAETAPHYFMLTDDAVKKYNTHAKMNPPLRSNQDRTAVREGLADGTIDVIATDHAPHSNLEKAVEFDKAANGIIGLETAVSLGLKLVAEGVISITDLIAKMSTHPARILGLQSGIQVGRSADFTILDPDISYEVEVAKFQSRSRNSPFDGWQLKGKPALTMVGGHIVFEDDRR
jgi:dihydroorotase